MKTNRVETRFLEFHDEKMRVTLASAKQALLCGCKGILGGCQGAQGYQVVSTGKVKSAPSGTILLL